MHAVETVGALRSVENVRAVVALRCVGTLVSTSNSSLGTYSFFNRSYYFYIMGDLILIFQLFEYTFCLSLCSSFIVPNCSSILLPLITIHLQF